MTEPKKPIAKKKKRVPRPTQPVTDRFMDELDAFLKAYLNKEEEKA